MKIDKRTKFYKWVTKNFNLNNNDIFSRKGRSSEMINMSTIEELKFEYSQLIVKL
ncbi:MAG: hypothetical protein ABIG64_07735 [Candidatus Omnitrophota bacterium]